MKDMKTIKKKNNNNCRLQDAFQVGAGVNVAGPRSDYLKLRACELPDCRYRGSGRRNLLHGWLHISCPFCRSVCGLSLFIVWSPSDQVTELCKLHFGSDKRSGTSL